MKYFFKDWHWADSTQHCSECDKRFCLDNSDEKCWASDNDWQLCTSCYLENLRRDGHTAEAERIETQIEKEEEPGMEWTTPVGSVLRYTGENGLPCDIEHANKYLIVGETYRLTDKQVGRCSTAVFLEEFGSQRFNIVNFTVVEAAPDLGDQDKYLMYV